MPAPAYQNAEGIASTGLVVTINKPTGTGEGDLLIANINYWRSETRPITWPSGWTELFNNTSLNSAGTTGAAQGIGFKVATGSEPDSYNFGCSETIRGGSISRYTGASAVAPINASAARIINVDANSLTATGVTTSVNDCTIACIYYHRVGSTTWNVGSSGLTERWDILSAMLGDEVLATAGASGANTANANSNGAVIAHTLALAPAPEATKLAMVL